MRHLSTTGLGPATLAVFLMAASVGPARAADIVSVADGDQEPAAPARPSPSSTQAGALSTRNPAGVSLAILPGTDLRLGTRVTFSVTTRQQGYLVIVDIDAQGRISQIFPNVMSLAQTSGEVASANLVKPGQSVTVPNATNRLARFVFTADEPRGSGAIVAMLSDHPVQLIDLPDVASADQDLQATVDALDTAVAGLKIAPTGASTTFTESAWSFAAVPYAIR